MTEEIKYRGCLFCHEEIRSSQSNTNFCNGRCRSRFRAGFTKERYLEKCAENQKLPIRGIRAPAQIRAALRRDSLHHRICKLSEYKDPKTGALVCDVKFATEIPNKLFHREECQVKYNDLKKAERRRQQREE